MSKFVLPHYDWAVLALLRGVDKVRGDAGNRPVLADSPANCPELLAHVATLTDVKVGYEESSRFQGIAIFKSIHKVYYFLHSERTFPSEPNLSMEYEQYLKKCLFKTISS